MFGRLGFIVVGTLICAFGLADSAAHSDENVWGGNKETLLRFLHKAVDERDGISSGSCLLGLRQSGGITEEAIYLLLPKSSPNGLSGYIVEVRGKSASSMSLVDNFGGVDIHDKEVEVIDASGGLWSNESLRLAAILILAHPMHTDHSFEEALARSPATDCPVPK